jgi:phosphatidylserine decarboxylase
MIVWTFVVLALMLAMAMVATFAGALVLAFSWAFVGLWVLFAVFTLFFFRDPEPRPATEPRVVLAPAHGKVDVIDTVEESSFMGGRCQRVSMFLSVFDVHVQNAPVAGTVTFYRYTEGKFLNAMKTESAAHNENALIGLEASGPAGTRIGVRLIAGLIARRIEAWVQPGEMLAAGDRMSLIQFGSRVDLYLPLTARVRVLKGERVAGGRTIIASLE